MGGSNSVSQPNNIFQPQNAFHSVVNRLADANPELGAMILAQRKRYQSISLINMAATIVRKSVELVYDIDNMCTLEFRYYVNRTATLTILQCVKEDSTRGLKW